MSWPASTCELRTETSPASPTASPPSPTPASQPPGSARPPRTETTGASHVPSVIEGGAARRRENGGGVMQARVGADATSDRTLRMDGGLGGAGRGTVARLSPVIIGRFRNDIGA